MKRTITIADRYRTPTYVYTNLLYLIILTCSKYKCISVVAPHSYRLAVIRQENSCCFKLSATWAITPAPALWNHSFFTWIYDKNSIKKQRSISKQRKKRECKLIQYVYVVMGEKRPECWVEADIDFLPSQLL